MALKLDLTPQERALLVFMLSVAALLTTPDVISTVSIADEFAGAFVAGGAGDDGVTMAVGSIGPWPVVQ